MRNNKEIRAEVKERIKPVKGKLMIFTLVFYLITMLITKVPFIGTIASILAAFFTIGFIATIINVYNGRGDEETPVSFFKHGIDYLPKTFFSYLWLMLYCLPGYIIMIIGIILAAVGGVSAQILPNMGIDSKAEMIGSLASSGVAIAGFIVMLVGIIVLIVISLRYSTISYEIIHDNQNKPAKQLLKEASAHIKGHLGQWICMLMYYSLTILGISILLAIIIGVFLGIISTFLPTTIYNAISTILNLALTILVEVLVMPEMIASLDTFYMELTGEQSNNQFNPDQQNNQNIQ